MSARDRILARLSAAPAWPTMSAPDVAAHFSRHARNEDHGARVARLVSCLEAGHTEVHRTDEAGWPALLAALCATKGVKSLLAGRNARAALPAKFAPASTTLKTYDAPIAGWKAELFGAVDAGFSVARSAIAETGSLIVWTGPEEPRLLSLVPPIHFVLLDEANVHATLFDAMKAEGWAGNLPTNALLISSPSKTADIQQTLAFGAHGPCELVVLLKQRIQEREGKAC